MHPDVPPPPHQERCVQAVGHVHCLLPRPPEPNVLPSSAQVPGLRPSGRAKADCRSGGQIPDHRCTVDLCPPNCGRRLVGSPSTTNLPSGRACSPLPEKQRCPGEYVRQKEGVALPPPQRDWHEFRARTGCKQVLTCQGRPSSARKSKAKTALCG